MALGQWRNTLAARSFPYRRAANGCARPRSDPRNPQPPRAGATRLATGEIPMGVGAEYRDKAGEIGRKYGDTLIGT
jgi:hypothetical protein